VYVSNGKAAVGPHDGEKVKFVFQGVYGGVVGEQMDQHDSNGATELQVGEEMGRHRAGVLVQRPPLDIPPGT
jgi:hypothetical protein